MGLKPVAVLLRQSPLQVLSDDLHQLVAGHLIDLRHAAAPFGHLTRGVEYLRSDGGPTRYSRTTL